MTETSHVAILGSSRGLGQALANHLLISSLQVKLLLVSRSPIKNPPEMVQPLRLDLAQSQNLPKLISYLVDFAPTHIFYVAGGGPHGNFAMKEWKDHHWALQLNLLTPAELVHHCLHFQKAQFPQLKQIVITGSSIAESQPDPLSSSYSMAKHGIKGLISSVQKENPNLDLRLFSPGYMDTNLLPPQAWPRREAKELHSPQKVARLMWEWSQNKEYYHQHYIMEPFATSNI